MKFKWNRREHASITRFSLFSLWAMDTKRDNTWHDFIRE